MILYHYYCLNFQFQEKKLLFYFLYNLLDKYTFKVIENDLKVMLK